MDFRHSQHCDMTLYFTRENLTMEVERVVVEHSSNEASLIIFFFWGAFIADLGRLWLSAVVGCARHQCEVSDGDGVRDGLSLWQVHTPRPCSHCVRGREGRC